MNWKTRKFRQRAALGFGVLLLLPLLANFSVMLWAVPFFALYWVYVICCLLLLEWLIAWRRGQERPELPFGPERWRGARTRQVMLLYVIIFTALREGLLAPDFVLNVQLFQSSSTQNYNTNTSTNSQSTGGEAFFAGRFTSCDITCSGDSVLCSAFQAQLRCDDETDPMSNRTDRLYINGSVSFSESPFCYTPLYKTGGTKYDGLLNLSANDNNAGKSGSFSINGSVSQETWGASSCYQFTWNVGQTTANQITNALNQFIQAN